MEGAPPEVIWLDVGNAGTDEIVTLVQRERRRILEFEGQLDASLLILSLGGQRGLTRLAAGGGLHDNVPPRLKSGR